MSETELLDDLIDRWESLRASGKEPSAEAICREHPHLLDPFKEKIARLKLFDSAFGVETEAFTADTRETGLFCQGRYKVETFHDQGGLGKLYLARDVELDRTVIVKGIRADRLNHGDSRRQFVNEAAITGQLEHPGIVPVYGFGRDEAGRPYYAMRMIRGTTLREAIRQFHRREGSEQERNVAFQRLLRDFLSVCQTIAFAHNRGVIHRDIKPQNIMLGKFGEVLVIDWGLAKHVALPEGEAASASLDGLDPIVLPEAQATRMGTVKGSPMYMSPEQASGKTSDVGPASDIYSLGATLYEIITGRVPFSGGSSHEILERVRRGMAARPRDIQPNLSPALEAICLKAMAHEPGARYATTKALAADLEAWLADEPVSAYREPWRERARRWAKRHRTLVTSAAAAVAVGALILLSAAVVLAQKNSDLIVANDKANEATKKANAETGRANAAAAEAERQKLAAQTAEQAERRRATELEESLYINQFMLATAAWRNNDVSRALDLLNATKPELRSIEWNYLHRLCQPPPRLAEKELRRFHADQVNGLQLSADGKWLHVEGFSEPPGEQGIFRFSRIVDAANGEGHAAIDLGDGFLAFSPDGKHVLDRELVENSNDPMQYHLRLREAATGRIVWRTEVLDDLSQNDIFQAAFLASAQPAADEPEWMVVTSMDKWITLPNNGPQTRIIEFQFRDAATGKLVKTVEEADAEQITHGITRAAFSPNGRYLAVTTSAPQFHFVPVLSAETGEIAFKLEGHTGRINRVAFSRDGRLIATASADRTVRLWDAATGRPLLVLWGHETPVFCVAFNADATQLASAGEDGTIRLWDAANGQPQRACLTRDEAIFGLAFDVAGTKLYCGGTNGALHVCDVGPEADARFIPEDAAVLYVRWRPDGRQFANVSASGMARVYDFPGGDAVFERFLFDSENDGHVFFFPNAAYSPDGASLALAGNSIVGLIDVATRKNRWSIRGVSGPIAFAPDGKRLVALREGQDLIEIIHRDNLADQVYGERAGNMIRTVIEKDMLHLFAYPAGDERLLEYLEEDQRNKKLIAYIKEHARRAFVLVDAETGEISRVLETDSLRIALHPAKPLLAAVDKGTIVLCDLETGKVVNRIKTRHVETKYDGISALAFSHDGSRLATVGAVDHLGYVWDTETWTELFTLQGHTKFISSVEFTSDGRRIVTGGLDETARIWNADGGAALWTFDTGRTPVTAIAIEPSGRTIAAGVGTNSILGGNSGGAMLWDVSPPDDK